MDNVQMPGMISIEYYKQPKGEFTLVIEGLTGEKTPELTEETEEQLMKLRDSGLTAKDAIARLSDESGLSRKELYRAWLRLK